MDIERKHMLNSLSDAIKECQLRFGGKRELATDIDGRVCFLCQKLEAIFSHGLKKRYNTSYYLSNNLQLNSIANNLKQSSIIKNTGNLISQFLGDDSSKTQNGTNQNEDQGTNVNDQLSFWQFIKHFMNRFDIERYEVLNYIKTDIGRQRSWLRSCLNEHCLERFTIAALANTNLINQYYEDWCFLLDKSCTSNLPKLISSLESILFAINIDSTNLNIPSRITKSLTVSVPSNLEPIEINQNEASSLPEKNFQEYMNAPQTETSKVLKLKNKHSKRKNNVIVFDNEESESSASPQLSPKMLIGSNSKINQGHYSKSGSNLDDNNKRLVNDINNIQETQSLNEKRINKLSISEDSEKSKTCELSPKITLNGNESPDTSCDGSTNEKNFDIYKCDSSSNLIPVNPSNSIKFDTVSIYSNQSETSSEINLNISKINHVNNTPEMSYSANLKPTEINNLLKKMISTKSETQVNMNIDELHEGLTLKEMREFVLTLIQRKDDLEEKYKRLEKNYKEETICNEGLIEKLKLFEEEKKTSFEYFENKNQNLESENKLLKDQLKKYVSAVQMIRSNNNNTTNIPNDTQESLPAKKENLQRDYSYEAEQYEKKLIQVAEMHGELMEFNSRLHKIINFKNIQVEKLKTELTELRGPLPIELTQEHLSEETGNVEVETLAESISQNSLINIWIPSAFLRSNQSDSYHVYQIYVRIKDEEWNVYRRFSHFYNLNSKLKEEYPIVSTISFPKKKAIGNKDLKFVENRRKMLQEYLRKIVNKISQIDEDLNSKPCRETLSKSIPFLSDRYFLNTPVNSGFLNQTSNYGNSLGHVIRTNTISNTNNFLNGNSEIMSNTPTLNNSNNFANEPMYTGL